ncbi:hypothetical protein NA57DRAFT_61014 [Rhizodiscina lignyota]|uniref:Uncharacterized protein n=1 Tax=Rhizodiscina lignyota TaxID=1504668 RepID=A0A9P4M3Z9_9PEZI|nr:hypothetical protein NA57DRAFT_61014 [Rhizodiscina lignyota]
MRYRLGPVSLPVESNSTVDTHNFPDIILLPDSTDSTCKHFMSHWRMHLELRAPSSAELLDKKLKDDGFRLFRLDGSAYDLTACCVGKADTRRAAGLELSRRFAHEVVVNECGIKFKGAYFNVWRFADMNRLRKQLAHVKSLYLSIEGASRHHDMEAKSVLEDKYVRVKTGVNNLVEIIAEKKLQSLHINYRWERLQRLTLKKATGTIMRTVRECASTEQHIRDILKPFLTLRNIPDVAISLTSQSHDFLQLRREQQLSGEPTPSSRHKVKKQCKLRRRLAKAHSGYTAAEALETQSKLNKAYERLCKPRTVNPNPTRAELLLLKRRRMKGIHPRVDTILRLPPTSAEEFERHFDDLRACAVARIRSGSLVTEERPLAGEWMMVLEAAEEVAMSLVAPAALEGEALAKAWRACEEGDMEKLRRAVGGLATYWAGLAGDAEDGPQHWKEAVVALSLELE